MYNESSHPTLINCAFSKNRAVGFGGAIYNSDSWPKLTNCTFGDNLAYTTGRGASSGGGMYNSGSTPTLINCTFGGNTAKVYGGAMYNYNSSSPTLTNCILWADSAPTGPEIYNSSSTAVVTYSNIEGGYSGTGNINSDPCFADVNDAAGPDDVFGTYDDGLRIEANDVNCIDAAHGDAAPLQDILGLDRIDMASQDNNGVGDPNYVDMGAYESYYGIDSDGDGIPDDYEKLNGLDPDDDTDAAKDLDGDGLSNETEYGIGTWAFSADTDGDGMDDKWENDYGLDPLEYSADNDADEDTISDLEEYQDGSNPTVYNAVTVTVYTYTNAGDVNTFTIQDADGNDVAVTEYAYDELGRTWRQRRWASAVGSNDVNDIVNLYAYDEQGRIVKSVRKAEINDPNVNIIEEPNDLVTKNTYDLLGRLTDVNDPNGGNTHYTYYTGGEPNQVTDPNGNTTTNYYDNAGRLEEVFDEEDHYREYHYDSLGRTIKQIAYDKDDNELMQTRFMYSGVGNVITRAVMAHADSPDVNSIDPNEDMVTDYTYDGNDGDYPGMLVSQTMYYGGDPATSAITYYEYDGLGRRTEVNDPDGNRTLLTYNEAGQVTCREQIDLDPIDDNDVTITTDYYYDSLGRLRHQVALLDVDDDNTWQITTYYYDELGNRTYEYSPDGVWTKYGYNALGQLEKKIADYGDGTINQTTEYAYDRLGRQTSIIGYADPNTAQTTQYEYDDLDRIWKITYPDTNEITYQYNEAGRVTRRNDQRGIVTTYAYDGVYNMTAKYVDGSSVTDDANEVFTYDGRGRMLTAAKDVNGTQISLDEFTYNDIGKITATDVNLFDMGTKTIEYTYDQAGFLTSTRYPYTTTLRADITPDWQGRIDTLQRGSYVNVKYEYIGSRVARRTYDLPKVYDVKSTMEYDNLGRLTNATTIRPFGNLTLTEFDYEYDPNSSNIAEITYVHRGDSNEVDFTYDDLDRLTVAEYSITDDSNEVFTIDDLGNRDNVNVRDGTDVNYVIDEYTNRYDSVGGSSLSYDFAGNLIEDHNSYEYDYDYENRIVKITKSGATKAEFAYDALGRRIWKRDSIADTNNISAHYGLFPARLATQNILTYPAINPSRQNPDPFFSSKSQFLSRLQSWSEEGRVSEGT